MSDFAMPSLGADMDEGTVLEWLVSPGDVVHKGDLVAVVDTAKAAVEVETFSEGVVTELVVPVGTKVPVGTVLARLAAIGEEAPTPPPPEPRPPAAQPQVHSPLVRRLAQQRGVDLGTVAGSGADGRITREDVERAAPPAAATATTDHSPAPTRARVTPYARRLAREHDLDLATVSPGDGETIRAADVRRAIDASGARPLTVAGDATPPTAATEAAARAAQMREAIAKLMARSKREIPHYYLETTVDLATALAWMRARNRDLPLSQRLVAAALLLKATALATAKHPQLNGFWVDEGFRPGSGVHLGVAVSLRGGGLVAPALHDVDRLSVEETMAGMRDLVTRARAGRLRGAEFTDPTLTVTNLGDQGVESVYGVIYPPQVALVGFGRVVERPWAVDGMLGVHPVTTVTLSADHRATDGFTGGRFLSAIDTLLQHPEDL